MRIVVNGGGKVGSFLAAAMVKNEHRVTLIERRREISQKVAREVPGALIILGDGCDVRYQDDAGVADADVFVSLTGDDDDNLVACQIAQGVFSVPRVIARVNNPKNEAIFNELGIEGVSSTTIISRLIEEEVSIGDIITLQTLKKGQLALVEIDLQDMSATSVGKRIRDIDLPADCVLVAVVRGGAVLIPKGDTRLDAGDSVIALTSVKREKTLKERLIGE